MDIKEFLSYIESGKELFVKVKINDFIFFQKFLIENGLSIKSNIHDDNNKIYYFDKNILQYDKYLKYGFVYLRTNYNNIRCIIFTNHDDESKNFELISIRYLKLEKLKSQN